MVKLLWWSYKMENEIIIDGITYVRKTTKKQEILDFIKDRLSGTAANYSSVEFYSDKSYIKIEMASANRSLAFAIYDVVKEVSEKYTKCFPEYSMRFDNKFTYINIKNIVEL